MRERAGELRSKGAELTRTLAQHKEALRRTIRSEGVRDLPRHALVESYSQVAQRFQQEEARHAEYVTRAGVIRQSL